MVEPITYKTRKFPVSLTQLFDHDYVYRTVALLQVVFLFVMRYVYPLTQVEYTPNHNKIILTFKANKIFFFLFFFFGKQIRLTKWEN